MNKEDSYIDHQIKLTQYFNKKQIQGKNTSFVVLYSNLLLTDYKIILRLERTRIIFMEDQLSSLEQ